MTWSSAENAAAEGDAATEQPRAGGPPVIQPLAFDQWMTTLDGLTLARLGVNASELPAVNYRSSYRRGMSPQQCLEDAIRYLLADERWRPEFEAGLRWSLDEAL